MLTIAICDDDATHLRRTAALVRRELAATASRAEIDPFPSREALTRVLQSGDYRPDVAILDIVLENGRDDDRPDETGIHVARELNRLLPSCRVIFLSGYPEYVSASYEAEHVWFVLKSQAETYLGPALRKAIAAPAGSDAVPGLAVRSERRDLILPLESILYIDRDGRKTRVVCTDESHLVSGTPAGLLTDAVRDSFVRCHQSYWVNLSAVKELDRDELVLTNEMRIPIGRTYRKETRERFFARYRG